MLGNFPPLLVLLLGLLLGMYVVPKVRARLGS